MARRAPRGNESEEFDLAGVGEATALNEAGETASEDAATTEALASTSETKEAAGETNAPAAETPAAVVEGFVVLFYDGDIPAAYFPVRTPVGTTYVYAKKGKNTNPLTQQIAAALLASKKGFSIASE